MDGDKELRKSKEEIKREFEEYKKSKKLDIESLKNLLSHCNVLPEIIVTYLNILQNEDKDLFFDELLFYYPILPVELCKKFNVKKTKSEKERFFDLVKKLLEIKLPNFEKKLLKFLENEILCYDEIKDLIPESELNKIKKVKEKEKREEEEDSSPFKYSRWFNNYNTSIDYKTENNEEYLFYNLSNSLISEFLKNQRCFIYRIKLIDIVIGLFEEVYSRRKEGERFCKYFKFLCMVLINCENNKNFANNLEPIILSIESEILNEFKNFDEIKEILNNNKIKYELEDKKIILKKNNNNFIIDDYELYNLNEEVIKSILGKRKHTYKNYLEQNIKFSEHLNKMKNSNYLLIKIIKKFSSSNLAISSIQKEDYRILFKELSENIKKYIYIMPYDCQYDTERTLKNPMKIIIDPYKEKYKLEIKYTNSNMELELALKEFCEIAFRKFVFEHEINHLVTVLLFYLYVNEDTNINSLIKELTSEGEIIIHTELTAKDLTENKNIYIQREAGNIFELLCYGSIQNSFTLKQLLIISDENNDALDFKSFKEKYEKDSKKELSVLLQEFPDNQLLSEHVKKINECLNKSPERSFLEKVLNKETIVKKDDVKEEVDFYTTLNDKAIVIEQERYDNHLIYEKRSTYNNPLKNNFK